MCRLSKQASMMALVGHWDNWVIYLNPFQLTLDIEMLLANNRNPQCVTVMLFV